MSTTGLSTNGHTKRKRKPVEPVVAAVVVVAVVMKKL